MTTNVANRVNRRISLANYIKDRPLVRVTAVDTDLGDEHLYLPFPLNDFMHARVNEKLVSGVSPVGRPGIVEIPEEGSYQGILEVMLRRRSLPNYLKREPPGINFGSIFSTRKESANAYEIGDMLEIERKRYASFQFYHIDNPQSALGLFESQLKCQDVPIEKVVDFLESL